MAIDYQEPHRREGLIGTLIVHGVLLLLFIFSVFKGPNPPLAALGGGDGVELNYGLDPAGSGDIQSMAPANNSPNREDSRPPQASPDPQPRPVATATPDPTPPSQQKIITSEAEESPMAAAPVETPAPAKEEVKVVKVPRKVAVTFSPKGSATGGGNGVNGTSNTPTGNNNGDRPGTVGDQGDPNGSLDAKALYGNGGDGTGSGRGNGRGAGDGNGLEMSGWRFENTPRVAAVDNESGVVRFKIKISADGDVEAVTKVSGNVSAAQEKLCRDKLLDANFVKTNSAAGGATGFYTFRISVR